MREFHGRSRTPIYGVWKGMRSRCYRASDIAFARYGGRGIKVCSQWRKSLSVFIRDMGERPSNRHTIERIDNAGNYTPSNCKWATYTEQSRNRRTNVNLRFKGKTLCAKDWALITVISKRTICGRIARGWGVSRALTTKAVHHSTCSGYVFGWLTITRPRCKLANRRYWAECRCVCGQVVCVRENNLFNRITTSCGCRLRSTHAARKIIDDLICQPL